MSGLNPASDRVPLVATGYGGGGGPTEARWFEIDMVSTTTSTVSDGWMDRIVPFQHPEAGGVIGWCLHPADLFVGPHPAAPRRRCLFCLCRGFLSGLE